MKIINETHHIIGTILPKRIARIIISSVALKNSADAIPQIIKTSLKNITKLMTL